MDCEILGLVKEKLGSFSGSDLNQKAGAALSRKDDGLRMPRT
jgi:hypothetical protein